MDTLRIKKYATRIERNELALKWLEEYGAKITGKNEASLSLRLDFAGGCDGAGEAAEVISSYLLLSLPEAVKSALASCRNTIQMDIEAIRQEAA